MNQMKASKKLNITVLLVVALLLIVCGIIGVGVGAKYKKSESVDAEVQFTADLAESVTLTEHSVSRTGDGSYSLTAAVEVDGVNEYEVMPGVDIPKDPAFTITDKSAIPAYLYVEILKSESFPNTVTYVVDEKWSELKDEYGNKVSGVNGGTVYVYNEVLTTTPSGPLYVLKDNKLVVSENYAGGEEFNLKFFGYMTQSIDGKSAAAIYDEVFKVS